ncbi:DUF4260 domain-containing protein [Halorubrum sp. RMP-47]|uniref:DUF4260 domain-containing protein n=1 Tax=Halorubrum miltondacostae TaxID=3076378 RepID=A0ABD5LXM5_9EURY
MNPTRLLRLEGAGIAAAAAAAYFAIGGPAWLFVLLALAPDVSMLAYLAGPRIGSAVYNAFHTSLAPLALGASGLWLGATPVVWIALVWGAHVGVDRAVGYGLKYPTGFGHTHLSPERIDPTDDTAPTASDATGTGGD